MTLPLEKIKTDESVWVDGATHYKSGIFYKKVAEVWIDCSDDSLSWNAAKWFEDAIPRPTKEDEDWLKVNSKVMTPKGVARVNKITEDDGVFTTLGNYCRSELSPSKAFVPEVGEWCEYKILGKWYKGFYVGKSIDGRVVMEDEVFPPTKCDDPEEFRPIKSEREKFVEAYKEIEAEAASKQGRLVDALYDSGKFKLVETDK